MTDAGRAAWLRLRAAGRWELTVAERRTLRRIRARWRLAERQRRRRLHLAKQRDGYTGHLDAYYHAETASFLDLHREEQAA